MMTSSNGLTVDSFQLVFKSVYFLTYCRSCIIPDDDGLGFKGRNVGFCQQLINFIDDNFYRWLDNE